jgi:3-oxoacyl-[acyl-carrier protein] reductase
MAFANAGVHVAVNDIDAAGASNVAQKIKSAQRKAIAVPGDVCKLEDVSRMMKATVDEFGQIDILINNAAISPKRQGGEPTMIWQVELEEWDRVMDVNLKGPFLCSREALKLMLPRKSGTIINISSLTGKAPFERTATGCHYDASKAALINLTQRVATEVAGQGIRVNGVCPGRIETPLIKASSPKWNEYMMSRTPLGRFGKAEEISNLVLYLASNLSGFIIGETVSINGGWFMD